MKVLIIATLLCSIGCLASAQTSSMPKNSPDAYIHGDVLVLEKVNDAKPMIHVVTISPHNSIRILCPNDFEFLSGRTSGGEVEIPSKGETPLFRFILTLPITKGVLSLTGKNGKLIVITLEMTSDQSKTLPSIRIVDDHIETK